ncbi:helix-turn-helix domain-containing protein [Candidatus Vondammii sp. HM_W22]|uniref:helix-turn-helix domain-containing protein n=1 Tax=Candidatus Vondammii sp. HM_W22 TaxID=2687299 RepID=UPI001F130F58|nr:helix-turn-helix transcriptional regulator [Candidatus Vondammii sp. HM_W22]
MNKKIKKGNALDEESNTLNNGVFDRLKKLREHFGVSQAEMDGLLGIGKKSWQRYESGGHTPGSQVIAALARLDCNANWLLTGSGAMIMAQQPTPEPEPPTERSSGEQKEWERQAEKFRTASQVAFDMTKDDPSSNPAAIWAALIVELVTLHGLEQSGVERLYETLRSLQDREEAK